MVWCSLSDAQLCNATIVHVQAELSGLLVLGAVQVYVQCALLYTTTDGARRVRISTLALPTSDQMGAIFKGADLDSQLASLTRQVGTASVCTRRCTCAVVIAVCSLFCCLEIVGLCF